MRGVNAEDATFIWYTALPSSQLMFILHNIIPEIMKPNILLLHGALGTKEQFRNLQKQLIDHFQVHTLDFAGHGSNASTAAYSIDLFTKNTVDYLAEYKLTKINIFGYSMGGYVALNLAKQHPDLVDKIMILGTKFNWTPENAEKEIKMLNPAKIEEKVPAFAKQLASIHTSNDWKGVMRRTANMMLALGAGEKLTMAELAQIKQQVLIGIGGADKMVSIEESQESSTVLPNGQLRIIEGFPHPIDRVNVEQLAEIIASFF